MIFHVGDIAHYHSCGVGCTTTGGKKKTRKFKIAFRIGNLRNLPFKHLLSARIRRASIRLAVTACVVIPLLSCWQENSSDTHRHSQAFFTTCYTKECPFVLILDRTASMCWIGRYLRSRGGKYLPIASHQPRKSVDGI